MNNNLNYTIEHIYALTRARTIEELWSLHVAKMAEFGFDRLLYGFTRYKTERSLGDPQDWIVLTNHNSDYVDRFFNDGFVEKSPLVLWSKNSEGARSWRWMEELHESGRLTPEQERLYQFNRRMNVVAGMTISFSSVSERTRGAIALTGAQGMSHDDVDEIWAQHGKELTIYNNIAHLKIITLPYSGKRSLTKRQREALEWVGDGKTTQDIAILMGLKTATVEKHLRLAREALDVETTPQAVLKASFYNQMFVIEQD